MRNEACRCGPGRAPSESGQGGGGSSSSSKAGAAVPPPPLTPEVKDKLAVANSIRALSPRIVAAFSPTRRASLAQLDECDLTPMILRSLAASRSFARLQFLCHPDPLAQLRAKERMFLHGMLDSRGVTQMDKPTNRCARPLD